ncbi:MAG TPA: hypothetical protein VK623_03940 [Flavobacterium sp.]|nr:hypothetical protein [Flavobacterium sp.]
MINKIFSRLLGLVALAGLFASCSDDQDVAAIVDQNKPTMTINVAPTFNTVESDTIHFSLTLSKPVGHSFTFYAVYQIQGSTADGTDSDVNSALGNTTFQKPFTVPAFVTTFEGEIIISEDYAYEENETLLITLGDSRTNAVIFTPVTTTVNISNVVSNSLDLTFDWNQSFKAAANGDPTLVDFTLCDLAYDVDILVFDGNGDAFGAGAQTGDCPEVLSMSTADYPDGTYVIGAYLYSTGDDMFPDFPGSTVDVSGINFPIPFKITYSRGGSQNLATEHTFTQEAGLTSADAPDTLIYLMTVVVENGVFTIMNDTETIASGRAALQARKLHLNHHS